MTVVSNSVLGSEHYPLAMTLAYSIGLFFTSLSQEDRTSKNRPGDQIYATFDEVLDDALYEIFAVSPYCENSICTYETYPTQFIRAYSWFDKFE